MNNVDVGANDDDFVASNNAAGVSALPVRMPNKTPSPMNSDLASKNTAPGVHVNNNNNNNNNDVNLSFEGAAPVPVTAAATASATVTEADADADAEESRNSNYGESTVDISANITGNADNVAAAPATEARTGAADNADAAKPQGADAAKRARIEHVMKATHHAVMQAYLDVYGPE